VTSSALGCDTLKLKLYIAILFFTLLTACNIQYSDGGSKDENIPNLLQNIEKKHDEKEKLPFNGVKDTKGKVNILIVGIDSRGNEQSRSDAIMIAQYNPKNKRAKLVSIMRDSYVEIPNYSKQFHKINTAYYLGGPELLRQTIKKNFGIDVEHFVAIDFKGFVKVVDLVAPHGIEVNVKDAIIKDMGLNLQPGVQRLHGKDLLAYARFRHDGESDFGRVKRQQEVLTSLKDEFVHRLGSVDGVFKLPSVGEELLGYVDTDMSMKSLISLGGNLLLNQVEHIDTMRIPLNSAYKNAKSSHAGSILELDFLKNKEALKEFLIDEPAPVTRDKGK
jgi:polyisoprenyl-teichoic acid--peptidoglycan teichoic acid transferase